MATTSGKRALRFARAGDPREGLRRGQATFLHMYTGQHAQRLVGAKGSYLPIVALRQSRCGASPLACAPCARATSTAAPLGASTPPGLAHSWQ
eukprot:6201916-Pleurochrysis_carterae.AAC.1